MRIDSKGINLIKTFEGIRLGAYLCPAGVATIGYGSTYYPDKTKVKMGDKLKDAAEADALLVVTVQPFENNVTALVNGTQITTNQFNALVSFAFNLGTAALAKSTLLKKVKANPNDPSITIEFMKWVNAGGVKLEGLVRRRKAEAELYFTK
jgi:lysozyme